MKQEGVVPAIVTDNQDPLKQGRVKVSLRGIDEQQETDWIRIAFPYGGPDKGYRFIPDIDDEVLVAFEFGNQRTPYVIGALWNGVDLPPGQDVRERVIRSKNGHQIRFLDSTPSGGSLGALIVEDAHGNRITLSNGKITIKSTAVLELDAPSIVLRGAGYTRIIAPNSNPI